MTHDEIIQTTIEVTRSIVGNGAMNPNVRRQVFDAAKAAVSNKSSAAAVERASTEDNRSAFGSNKPKD